MKMCEHCKGAEATECKKVYGTFVFLCENCFDGEKTMNQEQIDELNRQIDAQIKGEQQ